MNCQFFKLGKVKDVGVCSLGMYGGKPSQGVCNLCISKGENTKEHAAELFARFAKSHPPGVIRVSGCCDSALNPPQA